MPEHTPSFIERQEKLGTNFGDEFTIAELRSMREKVLSGISSRSALAELINSLTLDNDGFLEHIDAAIALKNRAGRKGETVELPLKRFLRNIVGRTRGPEHEGEGKTVPHQDQQQQQQGEETPAGVSGEEYSAAIAASAEEANAAAATVEGEEDDDDAGFWATVKDVAKAPFRATVNVGNEFINATNDVLNWAATKAHDFDEKTGLSLSGSAGDFIFESQEANPLQIPKFFGDPETTVGSVAEGISRFAIGMIGTGKITNAPKAARGVFRFLRNKGVRKNISKRLAQFFDASWRGGVVDGTMFAADEDTLMEVAEQFGVQNAVTDFLATDEGDSKAEMRFKNVIEGMILGAAMESIMLIGGGIIRKWRGAVKKGVKPSEAMVWRDDLVDRLRQMDETLTKKHPSDVVELVVGEDAKIMLKEIGESGLPAGTGKVIGRGFDNAGDALAQQASLRYAAGVSKRATHKLSVEQATIANDLARYYDNVKSLDDLASPTDGGDFNFNYLGGAGGAKAQIAALADIIGNPMALRRIGQQGHDVTDYLASVLYNSNNIQEAGSLARSVFDDTEFIAARLLAARHYMMDIARQTDNLARRADMNPNDGVITDQLAKAMDHLYDVTEYVSGTGANIGRGLEAMQIQAKGMGPVKVPPKSIFSEAVQGTPRVRVQDMTPTQVRAVARTVRLAEGDPTAILAADAAAKFTQAAKDAANAPFRKRMMAAAIEYRMHNMLSGVRTQMVNAISTLFATLIHPPELFWAGIRNSRTLTAAQSKALVHESADTMVGMALSLKDAMVTAGKAFRLARNVLDPEQMVDDRGAVQTFMGGGWWGTILRLPTRLLMTTDEFFKNVSYRGDIRAQSLALSRSDGLVDPDLIAKRLSEDMDQAFHLDGSATNRRGRDIARVNTFTNPLHIDGVEKTFGETLQKAVNAHPILRLVMPFVRTPVNLFRYVHSRTPVLSRWSKTWQADMAAGGRRAAIAKARVEFGYVAYASAFMLASQGIITGNGPRNKELRALWLANNKPYSFRLSDNTTISFRRGDPFSIPFGLVADLYDSMAELKRHHGDDELSRVAVSIIASITSNVASKTFFRGLVEGAEVLGSGDPEAARRWLASLANSFVPLSALAGQINEGLTPEYKEARTMMDEVLFGRVPDVPGFLGLPGFSERMMPSRNLFGEVILRPPNFFNRAFNPFTVMKGHDELSAELLELGRGYSMPAYIINNKMANQIDLRDPKWNLPGSNQTAYDRMVELMSTHGHGMPRLNLRETLVQFTKSEKWKRLSGTSDGSIGGARAVAVRALIEGHQQAAYGQLMKQNTKWKDLRDELIKQKKLYGAAVQGGQEGFLKQLNR